MTVRLFSAVSNQNAHPTVCTLDPEGTDAAIAGESGSRGGWIRSIHVLGGAAFALLLTLNVVRVVRHAMWRDELQIFQIAVNSPSLLELFHNLRYEAHGALWDGLVWVITRLTTDPTSMQILHAALAIAVMVLIYRYSAFTRLQKWLLVLSYFLFWEYFIVSRSYVLVALLGLAFVALRHHRPSDTLLPWLMLGLLANLVAHATIWSMALAAIFVMEERRRDIAFMAGAAAYLTCLSFGIATMIPAADYGPWAVHPAIYFARLNRTLVVPLGAFVPLDPAWIKSFFAFIANPVMPVPPFWNQNPMAYVAAHANTDHPFALAMGLAAPIALCGLITRHWLRTLEFSLAYVGILMFATLWNFVGNSRHHGIIFLAFIASAWLACARREPCWRSWLLTGVLAISALAGLFTLVSEFVPFSQGRNAAQWIRQHNLADAFLVGSRDAQVSTVAGYLGRPIHYLECQCSGTFIVWNSARQSPLSVEQFRERLAHALELAGPREIILIRNRPLASEEMAAEQIGFSAMLLQSFPGAATDENFWIYRLSRMGS
jgi:hypothetical protein